MDLLAFAKGVADHVEAEATKLGYRFRFALSTFTGTSCFYTG